jgi:hypothetical protein
MLAFQERDRPGWTPPAQEQAYYQLKSKQEELGNQLEDVSDRREELVRELQGRIADVDRAGLETRIKGLDARIIQIETDLASVGKDLAEKAPASMTVPPVRVQWRGYGDEDMVGAGFMGAGIMLALFIPLIIRNFRRRKTPQMTTTQAPALGAERIDRMEQAIDSIAVEIERVSENQRFMTRLMTETQLAGTIAAVRGSAEAAKAAAETSNA